MQKLILALFLLLLATPAYADSLASAHVTTTWDGSFTVEGINVTRIDETSFIDDNYSVNLLTVATAGPAEKQVRFGTDGGNRGFWLYGTGVGSISIAIPYTMTLTCQAEGFQAAAFASASVRASIGPGAGFNDEVFADCSTPFREGVLHVSKPLNNPTHGPLVSISVTAHTFVVAEVPEPASATFLIVALVGLGVVLRRSTRILKALNSLSSFSQRRRGRIRLRSPAS